MASDNQLLLKKRIWRWHFFAGIMVIPFAILLAATGSIYLFKPQIENYIENQINQGSISDKQNIVSSNRLVSQISGANPNASFRSYTLSKSNDPSVEIEFQENGTRYVYWVDQHDGSVLKKEAKQEQFLNVIRDLHGELLSGNNGSYIVELMASWMIVLVVTGLYLWWPKGKPGTSAILTLKQFLLPSLSNTSTREKYKRLHGAVGLWVSFMILILLLTGLPWTQVWGDGFDRVQAAMNWTSSTSAQARALESKKPLNDGLSLWERTREDEDKQVALESSITNQLQAISMQQIITQVSALNLEHPIVVQPPRGEKGVWTVRSRTANRSARVTVHYDQWTGEELMRANFSDAHPVSQAVSYGIALHEGALFGVLNQILGLVTTLGVITLSITGAVMWWSRRPNGQLAAPKKPKGYAVPRGVVAITFGLAIFLPMVAISLIVALILDFSYQKLSNGREQVAA
ncbi:PepSY domain-containing protein [Alteromonadaceae bacterium M269]|nr:PepSY domain-containing protein [Alteromonadaceae bacterium M269]